MGLSIKKQKAIAKERFQRLVRIYVLAVALSLSGYFLFALFDPGLLSYDLRQKFRAFADDTITVTATVLGPPAQPSVSATAICDTSNGQLRVELDWGNDPNSTSFDITRNSLPLVSGLSTSAYNDTSVVVGTNYSYVVTANGPMSPGSASSSPVSVTTPSACDVGLPDPSVSIVSFDEKGIDSYDGTPSTTDRRPLFTGTTNMPNADIEISVGPESLIFAQFSANSNGYFEWRPTDQLPFATQTFTVTATDPDDDAREAVAQIQFKIKKKTEEEDDKSETEDASENIPVTTGQNLPSDNTSSGDSSGGGKDMGSSEAPAKFQLTIGNTKKQVYQGQELYALLYIEHLEESFQSKTIPFRLSIIDDEGNVVLNVLREEFLRKGREVRSSLSIPPYLAAGEYLFQAEATFGDAVVGVSEKFTIIDLPVLDLGGGVVITYNDVVKNLSWAVLALLSFFIFIFFLLVREFGLYLRGKGHVAEGALKKAGYFDS